MSASARATDGARPRQLARRSWLWALLGLAVVAALPAEASAAADVGITDVVVPEGPESRGLARVVRRLLAHAIKRANFGKAHKVRFSARVTVLEMIEHGDVLKVRCTMVGRLSDGTSARSRLEFGGKPSEKTALRNKVLGMVADGLVTRLAQMARDRAE